MSNYCTESDVFRVWGTLNVHDWADVNGDASSETRSEQIASAIERASIQITQDVYLSQYIVPFGSPVPPSVKWMAARLTGVLLFETKSITATDSNSVITAAKEEYQKWVQFVNSGGFLEGASLKEIRPSETSHVSHTGIFGGMDELRKRAAFIADGGAVGPLPGGAWPSEVGGNGRVSRTPGSVRPY